MKITVITVNLNKKDGLEKTIKSVIEQTAFDNIEYIVIDGASTDGSVDIIRQYEQHISYWVSEKDGGVYNAMNKGVEHANGEYCLFLNSGDYFHSNDVIENVINELDADIVYGDLLLNGQTVKKYPNELPSNYFTYESLPHPSSFIKTSILKNNKYDVTYKIISDWIFFNEMIFQYGKTYKHINQVISNFNLGGLSSNVQKVKEEKEKYYKSINYDSIISIVVPCYNQGKYVKETIDSIKTSSYGDYECVIVNDGSTDNSEEVMLEAISGDSRFRYFKNENHGQSYSRNFGIKQTNSKYILCLDSDDKISPTYIENAIKYLNEHNDVALYYGNAKMFYDDGTEKDWRLQEFLYSKLLRFNMIYSSCIYRRKDYERCGGYDENMGGYEDWEFLIRLLYNNDKVYRTDDVVFYYRRHEGSMDTVVKKDIEKYRQYIREKNRDIFSSIQTNSSSGDTLDIFISTHKKFTPIVSKSAYKTVNCQNINNDTFNGIKGRFYSEIMSYFFIADNYPLKDYVGFCHYNKYWAFLNDIPNMYELLKDIELLVAKPLRFKRTIKEQYAYCHNIEDLYIVSGILAEKYPDYVKTWNKFLDGHIMFPYNMFIMRREEFLEYIKFMRDILDEFVNIIGKNIEKRIYDNVEKYLKDFSPNDELWYQFRIAGYLAERLTNAWILKNHNKIGTCAVTITEDKYAAQTSENDKSETN